jgi:hypothetical protein
VLELGALHLDIDRLCLDGLDLRLGLDHIRSRHRPLLVLVLGDRLRPLVLDNGPLEQAAQGVRGAQIEIGDRQLILRQEPGAGDIGCARLREANVALDQAPHLTPHVDVPGHRRLQRHAGNGAGRRDARAQGIV